MNIEDAKTMQAAVNHAITVAMGRINVSAKPGIACIDIEQSALYPDDGATALISPASPDGNQELAEFIREKLEKQGMGIGNIRFEW